MKNFIDLLDIPHIFSQQPLLTEDEFIKQYNKRIGVFGNEISFKQQLEALHRIGLLKPMYRFERNISEILLETEKLNYSPTQTLQILKRIPREDFKDNQLGRLIDPRTESFCDWDFYEHKIGDYTYSSSSFLYSTYQLLLAPIISKTINKMSSQRKDNSDSIFDRIYTVNADDLFVRRINEESKRNDELLIILSALENFYIPKLKGHWYLEHYSGFDIEQLLNYKRLFSCVALLEWFGTPSTTINTTASHLLRQANSFDCMEDWHELIQLCHPEMWQKLHGDVLIAFDHRIAAEILLRFYEDLIKADAAPPLEPTPRYFRGSYHNRLNPDPSQLNRVLMDFGISPDPSLILILEGETELNIVPKVMDLLDIPQHQNFIRLFESEGVKKDFGLLARFVAVPSFGEQLDKMVLLESPPTTFFVVMDAESKFDTAQSRRLERERWIEGIYKNLPKEHQNAVIKGQLKSLVLLDTWKNTIFEYAHFTDRELAQAIISLYTGHKQLSLSDMMKVVAKLRREKKNIDKVWENWKNISKVALSDALWPVLKRKIEVSKNPARIPIVRILLKAHDIAIHTHRRDVGIRSK